MSAPASASAAARAEIAKLQRVLGKKTLEKEILRDAVEYAAEKKMVARSPLSRGQGQEDGLPDEGGGALTCA